MIQLLRKCLYIFQLKVIPQSVKNLVLCGYWNHIKFLLKPGEGQAHANGFENHLIEVKEGDPVIGPFISTYWLPWSAREHSNVVVMPPREGTVIIGAGIPFVFPYGPGGE